MARMTTEHLTLKRDATGYRTTWYDSQGNRHHRRFGKRRTVALNRFARFHAEWKTRERTRNPWMEPPITIERAWELFYAFAQTQIGRAESFKYAMRQVLALFADLPAGEFGPKSLKRVQDRMIAEGICRNMVNQRTREIRHIWKWLTAEEHVEASVWHGLQAVSSIRPGYRDVRETDPIHPVPVEYVRLVIEKAPPTIRAMIELQHLTGMRPGEVCSIRPVDIDMSGKTWLYRPVRHKTSHLGRNRVVLIGPKGQRVIEPFLQRDVEAYLFSPRESRRQGFDACSTHRHQPVAEPRTGRRIGVRFKPQAYGHSIRSICKAHDIPHWSPNQLRHNMATRLRREFGLDIAQVVLGHSKADVTQMYAELDLQKAIAAIERIG